MTKTKRTVTYHIYKELNDVKIYKELLEDQYVAELIEEGKIARVHFYFDQSGRLIIDNVYKNLRNSSDPRSLKKYTENKDLTAIMMGFKP